VSGFLASSVTLSVNLWMQSPTRSWHPAHIGWKTGRLIALALWACSNHVSGYVHANRPHRLFSCRQAQGTSTRLVEVGDLSCRKIKPDRAGINLFSHHGRGQTRRGRGINSILLYVSPISKTMPPVLSLLRSSGTISLRPLTKIGRRTVLQPWPRSATTFSQLCSRTISTWPQLPEPE
jgi:hypothetical protein